MACSSITLSGISQACKNSIGGIKAIYAARKEDVTAVTVTADQSTGVGTVTVVTMTANAVFHEYKGTKDSSNFVSTYTVAPESGSAYWNTVLTSQWAHMDSVKRAQLQALLIDELVVIVLDRNGIYWMLGKDNGLEGSNGTTQTGSASGDLNGMTLEFTAAEPEPPIEVDATIIPQLLSGRGSIGM